MARVKDRSGSHLSLDSSVEPLALNSHSQRASRFRTHLAPDDIAELRTAIERSLCDGEMYGSLESVVDGDLRKSIRVACAKARLQRVRAEHLLIDVKQLWSAIPTVLTRTGKRLDVIVTACIDEYYARV
jgi:hypothetical protein